MDCRKKGCHDTEAAYLLHVDDVVQERSAWNALCREHAEAWLEYWLDFEAIGLEHVTVAPINNAVLLDWFPDGLD